MTDSNNKPDIKQDFLTFCQAMYEFTPNSFQLDLAERVLKGEHVTMRRIRTPGWVAFRQAFNAYLSANKGKYDL